MNLGVLRSGDLRSSAVAGAIVTHDLAAQAEKLVSASKGQA